jgi:hypothetical protein
LATLKITRVPEYCPKLINLVAIRELAIHGELALNGMLGSMGQINNFEDSKP